MTYGKLKRFIVVRRTEFGPRYLKECRGAAPVWVGNPEDATRFVDDKARDNAEIHQAQVCVAVRGET